MHLLSKVVQQSHTNLLRTIDWRLVVKMLFACVIAPCALVYGTLALLQPVGGSYTFWQLSLLAVIMFTEFLVVPAAAAYFSARGARVRPFIHAAVTVALGTIFYTTVFEDSLIAIVVWPAMGLLGFLVFSRRARAEA